MRRLLPVAVVALLVAALTPAAQTDVPRLMLVRVPVSSPEDARFLTSNFDETHNHSRDSVELLLWPGDAARLADAGFGYDVVVADVVADRSEPTGGATVSLPGPDRDDYRRLDDYESEMAALARKNPEMVRLIELPHQTLEERRVYAIEVGARVRSRDGRPTFYVDGIHHAREWPAGEYPMIFAHYLVERFGKDPRVTNLLKRVRVVVVPVVNADGFDYSRESVVDGQGVVGTGLGAAGIEAYWRKNRRSFSGLTMPALNKNPDAYGVDPNRNYGFMWGDNIGGSQGAPNYVGGAYRGNAPFSEPETENIRRLILSRHVTATITNHTYGRLVLRAWGHTSDDSPDEVVARRLGARMARAMGGYQNLKGIDLYATTGTTDDWAYAATGSIGFTFEHGDSFHPPYAESVGAEWRGVIRAFLIGAEAAADPDLHGVVKGRVLDRHGRPVPATIAITKTFKTRLWEGNPTGREAIREFLETSTKASDRGTFAWHVNPSTRPVAKKGAREEYTLVVVHRHYGKFLRISVRRGEVLDLGTLRLTKKLGNVEVVPALIR